MRLFVALEIPTAVRENLATLVRDLRELSSKMPDKRPLWVRSENLHVTLKFIGEADARQVEGIRGALSKIHSDAPVDLEFHQLGFFPNERRPRVLWAGVNASPNLPALAVDVDRALETQDIAREQREFTAHLTLARFEPPGLSEALRAAIQEKSSREFGSFQTHEFHLMESKLNSSGSVYTTVATFPFTVEP
ncbi:MAG: RNA 2',3'-cyclic phosphodiesterase [Candidatus Acidiferrum sp.]